MIAGRAIDHVGIAVRDLEQAIRRYELLGFRLAAREVVADQGVEVAFLTLEGGTSVELLAPVVEDGAVARFLARRGEGMHHLAILVDDVRAALAEARAQGWQPVDAEPRRGAGGKWIAFLHPRDTGGVLVELCQKP